MTDQTTDLTPAAPVELPPAFTADQVDNYLTLDQIMTSARRSRRTARICLAGDIEAEYLRAVEELSDLVTVEGKPVNEDSSMEDVGVISGLRDKIAALREQMNAQTFSVQFEAMDSDAWDLFEKAHRDPNGKIKNAVNWQNQMIAACAVQPTFTVDEVLAARKRLSPPQINELAAQAYAACTSGGVDVPKLPSFWHAPKPEESSLS